MSRTLGIRSTIDYFTLLVLAAMEPQLGVLHAGLPGYEEVPLPDLDRICCPRLGWILEDGKTLPPMWALYEIGPPITESNFAGHAIVGVTVTLEVWSRTVDSILEVYEFLYGSMQQAGILLQISGGLDDATDTGPIDLEQGGLFFRHVANFNLALSMNPNVGVA